MVSTRGRRPSATTHEANQAENLPVNLNPSIASDVAPEGVEITGSHGVTEDGPLRKRPHSASLTEDDQELQEQPRKRANLRKASSSVAKRTSHVKPAREKATSTPTRRGTRTADEGSQSTVLGGILTEDNGSLGQQSLAPHQTAGPEGPAPKGEADDPPQPTPDMNAVMSQIINHGETADSQFRFHNDISRAVNANLILPQSASSLLRAQCLPILDNLAVQVLAIFAKSSYQELLAITSDSSSEPGAAYSTLKLLFDHTKKVYSVREPFLVPRELDFNEHDQIETIRKANLATFVSSVFGSQDVGFYHLDEFFLDTFVADGSRLLKDKAGLFLDLKTQAYISAITNGERSREDILEDLFPDNLEHRLLNRRSGTKQPSSREADFIQRARNRKKALLEEPMTPESVAQLPEKYVWQDFLRDISSYISKNFNTIAGASGRKLSGTVRSTSVFEPDAVQQPKRPMPTKPPQGQPSQEVEDAPPTANAFAPRVAQMVPPDPYDIAEKAARAAEFAMQDFSVQQDSAGPTRRNSEHLPQQQPQQYPFHFEQQPAPYYTQNQVSDGAQLQAQLQQHPVAMGQAQNAYVNSPPVPYPTQSAPTSVLYERARQAATAKASTSNRRAGHPSQRRPWTQEEENALMHGLDQCKGPHWSMILGMYGPGGTTNETLKDRSQVQLKDKARNLKLFFLKSGIEVPYYLQFVTGELKTRAPQAARQAEQRERSMRQGEATTHELEGPPVDVGQAAGGAGEQAQEEYDTNTEDGEGEIIDPAEYAAVHGAGNQEGEEGQGAQDTVFADAQQQLSQAAAQADGS